jgi:mono/diheme cytochrome c family protein
MLRPRPVTQLVSSLGILVFFGSVAMAQPTIKHETARRAQSLEGADTYKTYCAVCHGEQGKGNGPAVAALKHPPADLSTYAQRHGGTFSHVDMREVIEGLTPIPAHGTRDMPIWGDVFRGLYQDRTLRDLLVVNLIKHIESLQVK